MFNTKPRFAHNDAIVRYRRVGTTILFNTGPNEDELARVLLDNSSPVWFPKRRLYFYLGRTDKDAYRGLLNSLDAIAVSNANAADRAMVMVDKSELTDPAIFQRGDPTQLGNTVPRQFLEALSQDRKPFQRGAGRLILYAIGDRETLNSPLGKSFGYITSVHHWSKTQVISPANEPPTIAAVRLSSGLSSANNYQTKALHRLILTSQATNAHHSFQTL